jgi:hypothetical protein
MYLTAKSGFKTVVRLLERKGKYCGGKLAMANSVGCGSGLLALSKNGTSPRKGGENG